MLNGAEALGLARVRRTGADRANAQTPGQDAPQHGHLQKKNKVPLYTPGSLWYNIVKLNIRDESRGTHIRELKRWNS